MAFNSMDTQLVLEVNIMNRIVRYWILAVMLLIMPGVLYAKQGTGSIILSDPRLDQFPSIQLSLRVFDTTGLPRTNLTSSDVTITENDIPSQDVLITSGENPPISFIYVIDLGRYAVYTGPDLDRLRLSLTTLVDSGAFQSGIDSVAILAQAASGGTDSTVVLLDLDD